MSPFRRRPPNATSLRAAMWRRFTVVARTCLTVAGAANVSVPRQVAAQMTGRGTTPQSYYSIVWNYAPFIVAETKSGDPRPQAIDHLLRYDFDGDNLSANNASNIVATPAVIVHGKPTVYYSITETGASSGDGSYFIAYYFYHPRDLGFIINFAGGQLYDSPGHPHDLEGVILHVLKDPYLPYGRPKAVLTQAHGALIPHAISSIMQSTSPVGGNWQGLMQFWPDPRQYDNRFVSNIRSVTHGTYAAQDGGEGCGRRYTRDTGHGIDAWRPFQDGTYLMCVHLGHNAILYIPGDDYNPPVALPESKLSGPAYYDLIALVDSPLWAFRENNQSVFMGWRYNIGSGLFGYSHFPSTTGLNASPPWAWRGGSGTGFGSFRWYSFGVDATGKAHTWKHWPTIPVGALVTDPNAVFTTLIPGLPGLNRATTYNAFTSTIPPWPDPPNPVAGIQLDPQEMPLAVNTVRRLNVLAFDAYGTQVPSPSGTWVSRQPSVATVDGLGFVTGKIQGAQATIVFDVNGIRDSSTVFVTEPPFSGVSISGPSVVKASAECTWSADKNGGVDPFTYVWKIDGIVRSDSTSTLTISTPSQAFLIETLVIDGTGTAFSDSSRVTISSTVPVCFASG